MLIKILIFIITFLAYVTSYQTSDQYDSSDFQIPRSKYYYYYVNPRLIRQQNQIGERSDRSDLYSSGDHGKLKIIKGIV